MLFAVALAVPFALACGGFGSATGDPVPVRPVYDPDVKAILDQHCTLCHVVPPRNGAPSYMRLDQYEDTALPDGTFIRGAGFMGCGIEFRAVQGNPTFMPPANQNQPQLDPNEKETIKRWAAHGLPEFVTSTDGAPCPSL